MSSEFFPRNDMTIVRKVKRSLIRGLHMPERSAEGVDFFVVAKSPDVKNLEVGDHIMIAGKGDDSFFPVPGEPDLLIVPQHLIVYVIRNIEGLSGAYDRVGDE